jgi:integrase
MPRQSKPWFRAASGTWVSRVRGKLVTLAHGKGSKAAATARLREILGGEKHDVGEELPQLPALGLGEMAEAFTAFARRDLATSTADGWSYLLGRFTRDLGADRPAASVMPLELVRWVEGQGWGRTYRSNAIAAVQRCYSWAHAMGLLAENRMRGVPKPGWERREVCPTSDEVARLIVEAWEPFRSLLIVLAETGARPSELTGSLVRDVDRDGRRIILSRHKTGRKTGRPRIIYLTSRAAEVVAARCRSRGEQDRVFRNRLGHPWTRSALAYRVVNARRRAGLGVHVTAYALRHWWITERLRAGVPVAVVAQLAGTSLQVIQAHYGHLEDHAADLRAAVERRPA